jgi:hypothetical protein
VRAPLAPLLAALLAACASPAPRPAGPPAPGPSLERWPPEVQAAIRERRVVRGMDAEAARLAWGEPDAVERTPSAAAPGLEYQRWSWRAGPGGPARFVWLADGRVVDVLVPPAGGPPAPTAPTR